MNNKRLRELKDVLKRASSKDRANLQKIIGATFGDSPSSLCDHFHYLREGLIDQIWTRRSYKQLVTDVADQIHIDWNALLRDRTWHDLATGEIEDAVVVTALQRMLKKLPEEDRRRLAHELGKEAKDPNLVGEIVSGGALVLARLTGFQIYLLATTTVGALTGALGIALPFAIYTTMTSVLGLILGPIGWGALAVSVLLRFNKANWSRLVPGIVYVSYIRHKFDSPQ